MDIVIDLGLDRGEPETYTAPRVSTVPAWFRPALLAVVVLLCSAASASPGRSALSTVFTLRAGTADAYALTDDGEVLVQTAGLLSAYDLDDGRKRWQSGQSTPAYRMRMSSGLVLMRPWTNSPGDPGTQAVSLATGADRWRRPGNVVSVAGSSTLLAVTGVRTLGGSGRRVEDRIEAVDPDTGRTRWTVPVPSTAVLLGVPGPGDGDGARMLLVHDDRTAALHDLTTGRLLTSVEMPPADYGPDNPAVAGGVVLLSHPGRTADPSAEISAYDPVTLRPLWTRPGDGVYAIRPCGALACLTGSQGVRAVDPATGAERWSRPAWQAVEQRGALSIAYASPDGTTPLGLFDPATGLLVADLDGWRLAGGSGGDHVVVIRTVDAGSRTMVAVARPGDTRPSLLAELPVGTGDCQAVPGRLVCRSGYGELVVRAYRRKG